MTDQRQHSPPCPKWSMALSRWSSPSGEMVRRHLCNDVCHHFCPNRKGTLPEASANTEHCRAVLSFPIAPPHFRQIGRLAVVHLYHFWLDHWSIAFLLIFCLAHFSKSNQFWIISSHRHCQVRVRPTKDPSLWQPIPTIATKWIQVCLRIIMMCHCFWDLLGYFRMGDTGLPERRKD